MTVEGIIQQEGPSQAPLALALGSPPSPLDLLYHPTTIIQQKFLTSAEIGTCPETYIGFQVGTCLTTTDFGIPCAILVFCL